MRLFLSIKKKLLIFVLCISLIPIVVIATTCYFSIRNTLKYQTLEKLKGLAESKRLHFLSLMEIKKTRAIDFSADKFIKSAFETVVREGISKQPEAASLQRYLIEDKLPLCRQLIAITLLDEHGKVTTSTSEKLIGKDISHKGVFPQDIGHNTVDVDQPHYFSYFDKDCVCISAPIISEYSAEPLGSIICTYSLTILSEIAINRAGMGETIELYLVNRDKMMLTKSRFIDNAPLRQMVDTEPVRQIIRGKKEYIGIYRDYRGIPAVGAALDIPEYGWILLAEMDKAEAFASLKKFGFITLFMGMIGIAAAAGAGTVFAVSTSRPVKDLTDAAEKFAWGELNFRVKANRKDEFGVLATCFNAMAEKLAGKIAEHKRMADELRTLNESLEQQVNDRTMSLAKGNEELRREIENRKQTEGRLKKYEILFSEIRDLAYICDTRGNILFVNKIFGILTGHKPEEFFGKPFAPLFDEENLKKAIDVCTRTVKGESLLFELSFRDTGRVCEYKNFPLRDEKGNIIGTIGTARDVTEQRRAESALRKSEASLSNAQRIAHVGNWEWNKEKNILYWSDEVYRIFGLSPQTSDISYEIFMNAIHPGDREYVRKSIHEALYEGKPFIIDHRISLPDGTVRFAHCQGEVIYDTTGKPIQMNGTIQDVTELKKIEEELKALNKSLEERVTKRTADLIMVNEKLRKEMAEHKLADESLHESEERYRNLVENALDVIYTLTVDGTIVSLNTAFETITGWLRTEWLHKQFIPLVHPDDRSIALKLLQRVHQKEIPPAFELRILSKSGNYLVGEFKVTPQIRKGSVIGILGIARDITERRRAEDVLRASESKYRLLIENLPQRIFSKDKALRFVSCNENLARDFHIRPDEITGKTDYDFFPKELAEKYRAEDKQIMESGQTDDREEEYMKDGKTLIVRMVRTPIKDEKGNVLGILGVFLDITEKITLQREAERSRHLASLGELAAGVAHEINNPITGVINCAQILLNKSSEGSKERDIAGRIIKEANRIANITSSLLSFARQGDAKEKKSIVSVHEIITNTLVLTEAQLRKEGITITLDVSQKLPQIIAHPQQIQQVFLNAISNARYALNQKYPEVHENKILEIIGEETTIDNRPAVKITFYDHGTGIPARIRDRVVEPFYTTKPRGKGTGLGLSISYSIIRDHEGRFIIDSVEGKFTKVSVVLPAFKPVS
ncbi:MAG: PAS domain S-box protein [Candidatus Jettenia caeni]|nr:PAS domain S-box protein [Candidatus Jettenia caeni]WKZ15779.1 MAG: PAS domain S-box protein [Candidatus Jettenia caeni]